jgi:hypothetical protein
MATTLVPFSSIPLHGYAQIDGKIYEKIKVVTSPDQKPYNAYGFKVQSYVVIADDQMVLPIPG